MLALHITEPLPSITVLSLDWIGIEALTLRLLAASEPDEGQGSELEHWHGVSCLLLSCDLSPWEQGDVQVCTSCSWLLLWTLASHSQGQLICTQTLNCSPAPGHGSFLCQTGPCPPALIHLLGGDTGVSVIPDGPEHRATQNSSPGAHLFMRMIGGWMAQEWQAK